MQATALRPGPEPLGPHAPAPANGSPSAAAAEGPDRVGHLLSSDARVAPGDLVVTVAELFFAQPMLEAVAVVDGERPVGLLTRGRLLFKLARNFGHELYARKPVTRIADLDPLVLPEDADVPAAVERAFARPPESVYDNVIVVDGRGRYLGHASVRELVHHQGLALERSSMEREAAVSRAADLEEVERMRAKFLAHATHELRSPVHAIVSVAELLRISAGRGNLDQVRARIPMLQQVAASLRGIVNNILDVSKLEAGRMQVSVETVDVAALAEEVAATTRLLLGAKPVEVKVVAGAGLELQSDGQKLRQILVNLASNAAKFTERGQIAIQVGPDGEGGAFVSVVDTGCGIDEKDLPRLFVPFGQLEDASTKAHAGTGLGLVITRSLANLLGGKVTVSSRRGEGSVFAVHLPRKPPPTPAELQR